MQTDMTQFQTELRDLCLKYAADWDQTDWLNMAVSLMNHAASAVYSVDIQHPDRMAPFDGEGIKYYTDPRRDILAPLVSLMTMSIDDRECDWSLFLESVNKILGQRSIAAQYALREANDPEGIEDYQDSRITLCCSFLAFAVITTIFSHDIAEWPGKRKDGCYHRLMEGFFKTIRKEEQRQGRINDR